MSDVKWNTVIVQCEEAQTIRPASELCSKKRVGMLIVPTDYIENSIVGRGLLKAQYKILTVIGEQDRKKTGADKLMGCHADVFDADGFQITPIDTENPILLLNDLRNCTNFLRDNLSQQLVIGWNLSKIKLKNREILQLLDQVAKGYRPNYLRFNDSQGLICEIAKKSCATKTALPYEADIESDYKVLTAQAAIKLGK